MENQEQAEVREYLTITLGEEQFALDINMVSEVLDLTSITKVPRMPEFVLGVINLRSNVVPVIDLRQKLDMGVAEKTRESCIVIVEVEIEGEMTRMGALTDSVDDVMAIAQDRIAPPPKLGTNIKPEFIQGMVKQDEEEKFIIILDIRRILTIEELSTVHEAGEIGRNRMEQSSGMYESAPEA